MGLFSQAPPTVTQTNQTILSPEQKALMAQVNPLIQQYGSQQTVLPTQTVAGFNPNQIAAQQAAVSMGNGAGQEQGNNAAAANNFLMNPNILNPSSNPYLAQHGQNIATTMDQSFLDSVLPGLRTGATMDSGPYAGGGTREGVAQGVASGRNSQAKGMALTDLYDRAYTTGLNAMDSGIKNSQGVQNGLMFGANVQGQVGQQQQTQAQTEMNAANQLQMLQQQLPFLKASDLLSLMQGMPGAKTVSTVTGATPQTGGVKGALGGAMSGAALGSMFPGIGTGIGAIGGGILGALG